MDANPSAQVFVLSRLQGRFQVLYKMHTADAALQVQLSQVLAKDVLADQCRNNIPTGQNGLVETQNASWTRRGL